MLCRLLLVGHGLAQLSEERTTKCSRVHAPASEKSGPASIRPRPEPVVADMSPRWSELADTGNVGLRAFHPKAGDRIQFRADVDRPCARHRFDVLGKGASPDSTQITPPGGPPRWRRGEALGMRPTARHKALCAKFGTWLGQVTSWHKSLCHHHHTNHHHSAEHMSSHIQSHSACAHAMGVAGHG
jgi:hypothetical protein